MTHHKKSLKRIYLGESEVPKLRRKHAHDNVTSMAVMHGRPLLSEGAL
jgi:hypothetical protein